MRGGGTRIGCTLGQGKGPILMECSFSCTFISISSNRSVFELGSVQDGRGARSQSAFLARFCSEEA